MAGNTNSDLGFKAFDADNHYYEGLDAFTRHVPAAMQPRCVQWAEIDGRKYHVVGGKVSRAVVNATFTAFNRWLDEDWGLNYNDRIYSAPYITLADPEWAIRELEWALDRDVRVIVMRPAAPTTAAGPRRVSDPVFDPFWARVNEAG